MPKKTFRKKTMKKKKMFKRRRGTPTTVVNRAQNPIAARTIVRMKYSEAFVRTLTASVNDDYQFNLNSINDPNRTGTGHQPYGHDTFQTLYNRYRVFAASWRITIASASSTTAYVALVPSNDVNAYTAFDAASESPRGFTKVIAPLSGNGPTIFKGHIALPRLNGSTKSQYMADDRFQAIFGNNPVELMSLHINAYSLATTVLSYNVELVYHCELFDPVFIGQS
jgi:hypothetical protein